MPFMQEKSQPYSKKLKDIFLQFRSNLPQQGGQSYTYDRKAVVMLRYLKYQRTN